MSKQMQLKHKANAPKELRERVERAASEGRFQTALDLAKQLNKQEPEPASSALLVRCYFGRARQLREQGATRDAATVLETAVQHVGTDPVRLLEIAEELARVGELSKALAIFARIPDPKPETKMVALGADVALQRGAAGRSLLPPNLHSDFDRVRQAFSQIEASQDEAASAMIQGIGLSSPFREWKVLLRGMLAYYQNDDARALENWSRLDQTRFPARLAAPLRAGIDPAFRSAQSAPARKILQQQAERLEPNAILTGLRSIQKNLHQGGNNAHALREVQSLLPIIRQSRPDIANRLATCFYWDTVEGGDPEDLKRYDRIFGQPVDDPEFARMSALAMERGSGYVGAQEVWQEYDKFLAGHPKLSPAERDRARAMVWFRMGGNASKQDAIVNAMNTLGPMPFEHADTPKPLNPGKATCFRKAIELAPDWLEPHVALFESLQGDVKPAKLIEVGCGLLARFPDHLPSVKSVVSLCRNEGKFDQALKILDTALAANPLSSELRNQYGELRVLAGGKHLLRAEFAKARAEFQAALQAMDRASQFMPLMALAACEFNAGENARAEELLAQAAGCIADRDAMDACMTALAGAWGLPKSIKMRFEKSFKQQLAGTPSSGAAAALAALFARLQTDGIAYYGSKTHIKNVISFANRTFKMPISEEQMNRLGNALVQLKAATPLGRLSREWRCTFPDSPYPPFFELESYVARDQRRWRIWRLRAIGEQARERAERMPPGPQRDGLLEKLDARMQQFHDLNPFASMFDRMADAFGGRNTEEDDPW